MTHEETEALAELLGDLAPQHDSPEAVDAMLWDLDDDDEEYLEYLAAQEAYHAAHGADASNY
jgi:hypothetical protein